MRTLRTLIVSGIVAGVGIAGQASGSVVYSDDFTGETEGSGPATGSNTWFVNGTGNGSTVSIAGSVGAPAPSLRLVDGSTNSPTTELNMGVQSFSDFAMSATDNVFTYKFDMRIDEYVQGQDGGAATFRTAIKDGASGTPQFVVVGFGRKSINDGDAGSDLFLFATPSTATFPIYNSANQVDESMAIGLNAGTGWAPGFDFGNYSTTTADNDTNDAFYRVSVQFTHGSNSVLVTAAQLDNAGTPTGNTAIKTVTTPTPMSFSKTGTDGFGFYGGSSSTGTAYFDNISLTIVPEPASLTLLGGLMLGLRRRRA